MAAVTGVCLVMPVTAFHGLNSTSGGPSALLSAVPPGLAQYWPGSQAECEAQMSEGRRKAGVMNTAKGWGGEGRSHPCRTADIGGGEGWDQEAPLSRSTAWDLGHTDSRPLLPGPRDGGSG